MEPHQTWKCKPFSARTAWGVCSATLHPGRASIAVYVCARSGNGLGCERRGVGGKSPPGVARTLVFMSAPPAQIACSQIGTAAALEYRRRPGARFIHACFRETKMTILTILTASAERLHRGSGCVIPGPKNGNFLSVGFSAHDERSIKCRLLPRMIPCLSPWAVTCSF